MNDNHTASTASECPTTDLTALRRAARHAASRESAADGLRRLEDRLRLLVELAGPLRDVVAMAERDPQRPIVLGDESLQQLSALLAAIHALYEQHRFHKRVVEDGPAAAPGWDAANRPHAAWRQRHALRSWQSGASAVDAEAPGVRRRYERAIAAALVFLQRFVTLDALQAHYYDDRHRFVAQIPAEPIAGTVEAWVQSARRAVTGGDELLPETLAEATFWRRACEIDPTLPAQDLWADGAGDAESAGALPANRLLAA